MAAEGCCALALRRRPWLRTHGLENQRRNLSRTFVLVDGGEVIGYYSLTMGGVQNDELPTAYGRGLPRSIDIGMVLLGRLAVATSRHGRGLGRDLLVDAVLQAVRGGEHAAARFIAVDPIDESAHGFYTRFGFRDVLGDKGGRMYLRIDEAVATFGIPDGEPG